ncbi:MAG TPA: hypothetical protein VIK78_15240 [Ruminiclostridium sp.]
MMYYIMSLITLIFAMSMMYMLLDCEIKHKKNWSVIILVERVNPN